MIGEIYCIENLINGKRYIGKTERGWEYRWKLHQRDASADQCGHYPIYRAIRKYGLENFKCYKIEDTDNVNEREKYWIQFYNTFGENGYNCTLGGDGRASINVSDEDIIEAYYEFGNVYKVADKFNCDRKAISTRLKKNGIQLKVLGYNSKIVYQYTLKDEYLNSFPSFRAAARHMIEIQATTSTNEISIASNIRLTANGERHHAYGFHWKLEKEVTDAILD